MNFINVRRLLNPIKINIKDYYKYNPLFYRFFFTIFYWVYMTLIIIIWFPISSHNAKKNQSSKQSLLFCND